MEAAKNIIQCSCGAISDVVCEGCGKTVCSGCFTRQTCTFDANNIVIKHYCPQCAHDIRKNVWRELYWKNLAALSV